jgi:exodeoxyribonuclease VII large subunit
VQHLDAGGRPTVLRSVDEAPAGTRLRVRVVDGAVLAVVTGDHDEVAERRQR